MNTRDLASLSADEKRALLARMLKQKKEARAFPLSFAQERLWFVDHLRPGTSLYAVPVAIRLNGALDVARLAACLDVLVARHESLRTRFVTRDGAPTQVIDAPVETPLALEDAAPASVQQRLESLATTPFDLARGPMLHRRLYRLAAEEHVLALVFHHIAVDYWSLQVIIRELVALYGGSGAPSEAGLPPLTLQYADYAAWQRQHEADFEQKLGFWTAELADAPQLLQLPTDKPRPAVQSFDGARFAFSLDAPVSAAIERTARAHGVTPFMVLLAAFQYLLHRYSGADDILVGSTVSNRDRPELRDVVGLFVNNIVLRTHIKEGDTFETLLARVRGTALNAFAHQDVPFERVVDALGVERSLGHNAVFQAMLVLHNTERRQFAVPGMQLSQIDASNRAARFDIGLDMYEGETYRGVFEYRTDLFDAATIARFATHFATLLGAVVEAPGRPLHAVNLLGKAETDRLAALNATAAPFPAEDVANLFEETVRRHGGAPAIACGNRRLSYEGLNQAANDLAARLRDVLPDSGRQPRIAICLPRSEELVVALLAVLKLGAAYIPLDPTHPAERLRQSLEDGETSLLIHRDMPASLAGIAAAPPCAMLDLAVPAPAAAAGNPQRQVGPDDLAYVIFTSGSTGRPKGVPIRQDSLVNLLTSMAHAPGMGAGDTFVAVTTPAFDIATLELLMPLLVGGRLVVAEAHVVYDDVALIRLLEESRATLMQATPATWRILTDAGWQAPAGFKMLCGGEALDPALARRLLAGAGELWNLYGPTETTIWSACIRLLPEHVEGPVVPIGAPIANTTLHVLDAHMQPVPAGVAGELFIGGVGLSPGYVNRADLTAEKFVANPLHAIDPAVHSARLYRTGDQVRQLDDGSILYLGRLDFQVKLRGFRIELGEIEAALAEAPGIEQAVVALWPEADGGGELVAYCRVTSETPADLDASLRGFLAGRVPGYMLPSAFVTLEAFPLNTNGKVDRKRLPRPERAAVAETHHAPRTPTETLVAELWGEILNVPRVGRDGHFFELGGHSLLAARMMARLRPIFETVPPLRLLFEKPRLRDFAAAIDAGLVLAPSAMAPIERIARAAPLPLSFAQQRQWALAQIEEESAAYHMPAAVRLNGVLDIVRLQRAFVLLGERQEALRSHFPIVDGRPGVDISPTLDLAIFSRTVAEDELEGAMLAEARRPFDLATGPLVRVALFTGGMHRHTLLLVLHHIIADALSVDILVRELSQLYADLGRGETPRLMALPVQYVDFAAWQRHQPLDAQLTYWRRVLKDAPALLDLPTDFPRPTVQDFAGDSVRFAIGPQLAGRWRAMGVKSGATAYMTMLSAFAALLGRASGMNDVLVGTPVTQRPHASLEGLIGMFVNTLVLRLDCAPDTSFASLLANARLRVLEAFAHQDAPFEQVVDALALPRGIGHNPLFQAMFVWHAQEKHGVQRPAGLHWERVRLPDRTARVDLSLIVHDGDSGFDCKLEYRTDLFERQTIVGMANALTRLLEAVTASSDATLGALLGAEAMPGRKALAAPDHLEPAAPAEAAPEIEARLADIWRELLWRPEIGRHDDFFSLGGDSMLAIQTVARLRKLGFRLSPRDLFQHPTLAGLASRIHAATGETSLPAHRAFDIDLPADLRETTESAYPLTPMQEGLLFHSVFQPQDGLYMPQVVLHLSGTIDAAVLEQAWQDVVERHAVLRTSFHWEERDVPFQRVRHPAAAQLRGLDWSDADAATVDDRLGALLEDNRRQPFDLRRPPLARLKFVRCAGGRSLLVFSYHHIILDGWSAARVLSDMFEQYRARADGLALRLAPARPYGDYVGWLAQQDSTAAAAFWKTYLAGHAGSTRLLPVAEGSAFASRKWSSSAALKAALESFCQACGITLNTVLQGAVGLLIARATGSGDVLFGTTVAGRPPDLDGAGDMVGLFINTLPVRAWIDPAASLTQWLRGLQHRQAEASEHGFQPLRAIQGDAPPLFDCLLILESYPVAREALAGAPFRLDGVDFEELTHYPLTLYVAEGETLEFTARYAEGALDAGTLDGILAEIGALLEAFVADPQASLSRWAPVARETPAPTTPDSRTAPSAPSRDDQGPAETPTEKMLALAWADILKIPEPGKAAHFFDLGGHSLLATRVIGRVRRAFGMELPVKALFDRPVLADLATYIDALRILSAPRDDATAIDI